jgi:hypothetical protein
MYMRRSLIILAALSAATAAGAGDVSFSLNINDIPLEPRPDPRTEARLAQWNDPMGRLLYHFNQQQSWVMRGTMPGSDRATGIAIGVKAQNGVPLQVLSSVVLSGLNLANHDLAETRWPWIDDEELGEMPLVDQISVELGRRLVPR